MGRYVDRYDLYQKISSRMEVLAGNLMVNEVLEMLWIYLIVDFITKLSKSQIIDFIFIFCFYFCFLFSIYFYLELGFSVMSHSQLSQICHTMYHASHEVTIECSRSF